MTGQELKTMLWRWILGRLPPPRYDDQLVARQAYADYIGAQVDGFAPANAAALRDQLFVKSSSLSGTGGSTGSPAPASFAQLMGVETELAASIDDALVERTYWVVRERFTRIASVRAIEEHSRWSPPSLVEPADRIPIPHPTIPDADAEATTDPIIDSAALESDAAEREAEVRHAQSVALADADDASDTGSSAASDNPLEATPPPSDSPTAAAEQPASADAAPVATDESLAASPPIQPTAPQPPILDTEREKDS